MQTSSPASASIAVFLFALSALSYAANGGRFERAYRKNFGSRSVTIWARRETARNRPDDASVIKANRRELTAALEEIRQELSPDAENGAVKRLQNEAGANAVSLDGKSELFDFFSQIAQASSFSGEIYSPLSPPSATNKNDLSRIKNLTLDENRRAIALAKAGARLFIEDEAVAFLADTAANFLSGLGCEYFYIIVSAKRAGAEKGGFFCVSGGESAPALSDVIGINKTQDALIARAPNAGAASVPSVRPELVCVYAEAETALKAVCAAKTAAAAGIKNTKLLYSKVFACPVSSRFLFFTNSGDAADHCYYPAGD